MGNYQFVEDTLNDKNLIRRIEDRRKAAYLGSRMHFFRELWRNNLGSAGFEMKDSLFIKIDYKKIVVESKREGDPDVSKFLNYNGKIYIGYHDNLYVTIIRINKDHIFFNKDGLKCQIKGSEIFCHLNIHPACLNTDLSEYITAGSLVEICYIDA